MLIEKRFIQDDSRTCYKHSCAKKKLKVVMWFLKNATAKSNVFRGA